MTVKYVVLSKQIEKEISELKKIERAMAQGLAKLKKGLDEKQYYLDSIALNLHAFYTGVENILKNIASKVDGELPTGERWHSELLDQTTTPLNDIRPSVLSKEISDELRDLLAFRHRIRNIYTFQIDEENVIKMCKALNSYGKKLFSELNEFVVFLKITGENS